MNSHPTATLPGAVDRRWGFLIAGTCAVGVAACVQLSHAGLPEHALAKLPAALVSAYAAAGKLLLSAPLAALGALLIAANLVANRRTASEIRHTMPHAPRPTPSRAAFYLPAPPPVPAPFPPAREELEVGEPIAEDEPEPARPSARPAQFAARRSSRSVPAGLRRTGVGTQATIELATEKYLHSRPEPGRGSQPGA